MVLNHLYIKVLSIPSWCHRWFKALYHMPLTVPWNTMKKKAFKTFIHFKVEWKYPISEAKVKLEIKLQSGQVRDNLCIHPYPLKKATRENLLEFSMIFKSQIPRQISCSVFCLLFFWWRISVHRGICKIKKDVRYKILLQMCRCTPVKYLKGKKEIYFYLFTFLQLFASLFSF